MLSELLVNVALYDIDRFKSAELKQNSLDFPIEIRARATSVEPDSQIQLS